MRLKDQLCTMRQAILQAAQEGGASDVRLFGSVARGEERPDSDIDFLLTLEPGRTLLDLVRLEARLEALTSMLPQWRGSGSQFAARRFGRRFVSEGGRSLVTLLIT